MTNPIITTSNVVASSVADIANNAGNFILQTAQNVGGAILGQRTTATFTQPDLTGTLGFGGSTAPNSVKNYAYPKDIVGNYDFLQIQITQFVPITRATSINSTTTSEVTGPVTTNNGNIFTALLTGTVQALPTGLAGIAAVASTPLLLSTNTTTQNVTTRNDFRLGSIQTDNSKEVLANISLPMPDAIVFSDGISYTNSSGGAVARLAPSILSNGDQIQNIQNVSSVGADQLLSNIVSKNAANLVGSTEQFTQGLSGQILNPFIEQVFKGIEPRDFSFNWNLIARNPAEQVEIQQLIKTLRKFAHPNYSKDLAGNNANAINQEFLNVFNNNTSNVADRWLTVPDIFNLSFNHYDGTQILFLQQFKPAVCTGVTVNSTPDNAWIAHQTDDSDTPSHAPVAIKLTMNFKETEILSRNDVEAGF